MNFFNNLKLQARKALKYLIFFLLYPLVFIMDKIKKYKFFQLAEIDIERIGAPGHMVEGYLVAKNFFNHTNRNIIIFYFTSVNIK